MEDPLGKPPFYNIGHKWTKKSIFWDLPYWRTHLLRHNLDVMHIEKNVFDAVFGTLMDLKGKTKDTVNARKDISEICDRENIAVDPNSIPRSIPKAVFNLTAEQQAIILSWLTELKFPDGYASNVKRCVQRGGKHLSGMKSHDCHVFMQRLLPVAFKEMLPPSVWNPITELSLLFRCLCSTILDINKVRQLQEEAPVILCNLEKVFPPAFFDSMEHVVVHLPYEALVGGPVQYRWMYPFERYHSSSLYSVVYYYSIVCN